MRRKITSLLMVFITAFVLFGCGSNSLANIQTEAISDEISDFEVHFIDVGQADAALVFSNGKTMLIDGGNREDSSLIAAYLKKYNVQSLDYVICSHAHEDHVGGLSGALSVAKAGTVFAPKKMSDTKVCQSFLQKVEEQGLIVQHPEPGKSFSFGNSQVQFFGPVKEDYGDFNNTSVVMKITYGKTSFLFTGDAESEAEHDIIEQHYDLKSTVLKVGHHGSDTSSSYVFLREVMPQYAVISVGENNSYGHPGETVMSRLRDVGTQVYRTDMQGDIVCRSDGERVTFKTAKHQDAVTNEAEINGTGQNAIDTAGTYIGNSRSKKFHKPNCRSLPQENNSVYFSSRSEAVNAGYSPCGNCNP